MIKTPIATLGVRGTIFDARVQRGLNTIFLVSGEVTVCVQGKSAISSTRTSR